MVVSISLVLVFIQKYFAKYNAIDVTHVVFSIFMVGSFVLFLGSNVNRFRRH